MGEKFKKLKEENKILVMLAFFSISIGLWTNFKQLWLQDNNLEVEKISQILSVSGLFCVIALILFAKKVSLKNIQKVITIALLVKAIILIILATLNHTQNKNSIEILIILDAILENLIVISIYPLIVTVKKENKLYSKRKLVEYLFKDIGILIGGVLIGKAILGIVVDYNVCLVVSIVFLILAFITISNIKRTVTIEKPTSFKESLKFVIKDKVQRNYYVYILFSETAMNTGLGLKMLMLTNQIGFSDANATNYLLIVGLLADAIGIFILKYLTPKNDYLTITLKFGIRFWFYTMAFLSNNLTSCLIAISWSILISTAYENVVDAPYVNRIPNEYQILFTNYRYIVKTIGSSIGLYFAGMVYPLGIPYMLGLSAFFMIFQISCAYYLVYLKKKEEEEEVNESQLQKS